MNSKEAPMRKSIPVILTTVLLIAAPLAAQSQDPKPLLDTVSIEAEGIYEAEPDLGVLLFSVFAQEKDLKRAYEKVTGSVQSLVELAQRFGVPREDITTGVFTVQPLYDGKNRARSFQVSTRINMKVRDLAKVGGLLDETVQQGFVEFRSLEYRLADEEAAKQKAVEQAMQRATARARAALGQNGRKLGGLRLVNIDVREIEAAPRSVTYRRYSDFSSYAGLRSGMEAEPGPPPLPLPPTSPERIRVQATVKCLFQIE
jgi:uncharacterized protein YggE